LEADGLVATLRKHIDVLRRVRRADVKLRVSGERRLAPKVERELFRIAQEALNNVLNHAQASRTAIALDMNERRVTLSVRDDGRGFDPLAPDVRSKRLGLTSRRERADALGGAAVIESTPGGGTTVCVEVPLG
jgi:signal transduction histidine kinase